MGGRVFQLLALRGSSRRCGQVCGLRNDAAVPSCCEQAGQAEMQAACRVDAAFSASCCQCTNTVFSHVDQ